MKHIFVTIEEFLQNGGTLEEGREFYAWNVTPVQNQYTYTQAGYFLRYDGNMIMMKGLSSIHPALTSVFCVKIEVTPIWK